MPGGAYPPPEVVASWPKPNYVNPETRGPALVITCIILSAMGAIVVTARLYARLVITKAAGLDDVIIVVALFLAIGLSTLTVYGVKACYSGHHIWDIPISGYVALRLNAWLSQCFNVGALCAVKISLLLFYRRLTVTFSSLFLWATYVGIGYNFVYFFIVVVSISFECRPTAAYWLAVDPEWLAAGHTYYCARIENVILPVYSALSVIGDFYSTTLPLCLVYSLKMDIRQKISLYCLFVLGYLVVGAGIARTVFINEVENETYDTSWRYFDAILWVIVETYLAIFCASAPGLKPFVKKFLVGSMTQSSSSQLQHRSGYTFGYSGKERGQIETRIDSYLYDVRNEEESWTKDGLALELSDFDKQYRDKPGVIIHETSECFHDRPRHSLVAYEISTGLEQSLVDNQSEQYRMVQQNPNDQYRHWHQLVPSQSTAHNPADRHSYNSEESILEGPQILENRVYSNPHQVVPFVLHVPLPVPVERAYAPYGRDPSFVTISAFPMPQARAPSRISETEEQGTEDEEIDFELPLQGTRENTPTDMRPMKPTQQHLRSKSKES